MSFVLGLEYAMRTHVAAADKQVVLSHLEVAAYESINGISFSKNPVSQMVARWMNEQNPKSPQERYDALDKAFDIILDVWRDELNR